MYAELYARTILPRNVWQISWVWILGILSHDGDEAAIFLVERHCLMEIKASE